MFLSEYALIHQPALPESNWYGSTSGFVLSREMNLALRGRSQKQPGWGLGDIVYAFPRSTRRSSDLPFEPCDSHFTWDTHLLGPDML